MEIVWKEWTTVPDKNSFGHGVHFHDIRKPRDTSLIAWLEGYRWSHENSKVVTIWCIAPDTITTIDVLTEMKGVISKQLRNKKKLFGLISPRIEGIPNA
jgi:hypothetical protein